MATDPKHDHYFRVGQIAVFASRLEWTVEHFLADAITFDIEISNRVTSGMPFERKVDLLGSILAVRLAGHIKLPRISTQLAEAKALMRERNAFMHGLWEEPSGDGERLLRSRKRMTSEPMLREIPDQELVNIAQRLSKTNARLEVEYLSVLEEIGVFEKYAGGLRRPTPKRWSDNASSDEVNLE